MARPPYSRGKIAGLICVLALSASCSTTGDAVKRSGTQSGEPAARIVPQPSFAQLGGASVSIADVAERVLPSVVNISSSRVVRMPGRVLPFHDPFFEHFFGPFRSVPRERREQGLGSGVIVSADGVVLTNHHVVEGAQEIKITTADRREFDAEIVGSDEKSDLAVLRIQGKPEGLVPIRFGNSSALRLGEVVLAVGNPFGLGQTVTMGIVSALGRANMGIVDYEDFIQTDAPINPGNSGGALVNMAGELVGINTAILSRSGGYQGIGFAIPSNMAQPIMDSLLEDGKVERGWLGVSVQDLDQALAQSFSLKSTRGALVSDVEPGSPADKAGLRRGDVILELDGEVIDSTAELRNLIAVKGSKRKVVLKVQRGTTIHTFEVTLAEQPKSDTVARWRRRGFAG